VSVIETRSQAIAGATDREALETFFAGVSTGLSQGQGLPSTIPETVERLSSPELLQRLRLFTNNVRRLPESVHGRLAIALNRDQVPSKLWLIDRLSATMPLADSRFLIVGGWYGILPLLLQCLHPSWHMETDLVDVDASACEVAALLLDGIVDDLNITCMDAKELDYREFRRVARGVVVNTVCEHMSDFVDWFRLVQPGQRVALQSNDHKGCSEHTNWVVSLEALEAQAPLAEVHFRGTLQLANFRRFMLIGRR